MSETTFIEFDTLLLFDLLQLLETNSEIAGNLIKEIGLYFLFQHFSSSRRK